MGTSTIFHGFYKAEIILFNYCRSKSHSSMNNFICFSGYPPGLKSYPNAQRSFGDVAGSTILGDISFMTIGFMIVYAYVMLMLGKFSCVEQRLYLSVIGIMGIVMGIIVSYGLCSALGLFFGPMHNVLPFLLLGIGIDDMFVIVQSWDTLSIKDQAGITCALLDMINSFYKTWN